MSEEKKVVNEQKNEAVGTRTCFIRYEANGHGDKAPLASQSKGNVIVTAPEMKEKGYTFKGWNTKPDGSGVNYAPNKEISCDNIPGNTLVLYAVWKQKNKLIVPVIILAAALIAAGFGLWYFLSHQKTAVIAPAQVEDTHDTSDGQIRIKISSAVDIKDGTMQNLNFQNINTDRLMKCKIKLEGSDSYIYESQFVEYGEMITADFIKTGSMKSGENLAIAELYTYNTKTKEKIGQVNVKLVLINN